MHGVWKSLNLPLDFIVNLKPLYENKNIKKIFKWS